MSNPEPEEPEIGDTREISYFAWLPVWIEGMGLRWLETVRIHQRYESWWDDTTHAEASLSVEYRGWVDISFLDQ